MSATVKLAFIAFFALCWCSGAWAQLARLGDEFRINEGPLTDSTGSRIATVGDGGFVVVWDSKGRDGDGSSVLGRRFNSDGSPVSGEFLVNSTTLGDQMAPRIAAATDGSFFVVWSAGSAVGQAFDATGERRGEETSIAEPEVLGPADSIAAAPDGAFVVTFTDFLSGGRHAVRARKMGFDGQAVAPSFEVSSDPFSCDEFSSIATGVGDAFMVVWLDDEAQIEGRRFETADPIPPKFPVGNAYDQGPEICGHEDGGFVVTWATYDGDSSDRVAQYRRYNAAGEAITEVLRASPQRHPQHVNRPMITCGPNSAFTVVWDEVQSDCHNAIGGVSSVCGRSFNGDSAAMFTISAGTPRAVRAPTVATLNNDDSILTWLECDDNDTCDIVAQRFTPSDPVDCPGDCDRSGVVTIDELVRSVDIALTTVPGEMKQCLPADTDLDYRVSVNELVAAVNQLLQGCGA